MSETHEPSEPGQSVTASWRRIERWLATHAPRTYAGLRDPLPPDRIADAQLRTGIDFPPDLVASLGCHDGVVGPGRLHDGFGVPFLLPGGDGLMGVEEIVRTAAIDQKVLRGIEPLDDEWPVPAWWHPQFLMFASHVTPDGLALDCRPGPGCGRVGHFAKDSGVTFDGWPSLADMLGDLADGLEEGVASDAFGQDWVPVVWEGELIWERDEDPLPPLPSLFALAASRTEPAPPDRDCTYGRTPVAEEGWAGEYANFTLTFVHGVDETELLRRYGAVESTGRPRDREEASADATRWTSGFLPVVRAGRAGEWAFGIEEIPRSQGDRPEVLRRLSVGTRAVSVRFSGHTFLTFYEDGALVTEYRDHLPYDMDGVRSPHAVFEGLPQRPEEPSESGPALGRGLLRSLGPLTLPTPETERAARDVLRTVCDVVARHFGIDLPPGALTGPLASAHVLPVLSAVRRFPPVRDGLGRRADAAPDARVRRAVAAQTAALCAETGLDTCPEVVEAVAAYGRTGPEGVDDESPLGRRLRTLLAEAALATRLPRDERGRLRIESQQITAWQERARAAETVIAVLTVPPREALPALLRERRDAHAREDLAAALGGWGG